MKLKKFNEIHFQGGNYENGDPHSYKQVDDDTSNEIFPSEEQYINLCYIKESSGYANLETGELMNLSDVKDRYKWLIKKHEKY